MRLPCVSAHSPQFQGTSKQPTLRALPGLHAANLTGLKKSSAGAAAHLEEEAAGDFFHGCAWLSKARTLRVARRPWGRKGISCAQDLIGNRSTAGCAVRQVLGCFGSSIIDDLVLLPLQQHRLRLTCLWYLIRRQIMLRKESHGWPQMCAACQRAPPDKGWETHTDIQKNA